jgi:hypothetical protein
MADLKEQCVCIRFGFKLAKKKDTGTLKMFKVVSGD